MRFHLAILSSVRFPGQWAGSVPRIVTIEGPFGKAEMDVEAPAMVRLYLRGPEGLTKQSLLAPNGGCTYVVGQDGRRYESRLAKPEKVELGRQDARPTVKITGIKLSAGTGREPVATEDWTLVRSRRRLPIDLEDHAALAEGFYLGVIGQSGIVLPVRAKRPNGGEEFGHQHDLVRSLAHRRQAL